MSGFKLKRVNFCTNFLLKNFFIDFLKFSEYMHETVIKYPKVRKMSRKMNDIIKKNTNSRIEETLGKSDGIIEEMETN